MAVTIDPDLRRAASHENMIEHLTAPLAAGAGDTVVPVAATAQATVDWRARHPLLLAAPSQPLEGSGLLLRATVPASGGGTTTVDLEFAPYTETGAFLPVFLAPVDTTDLAMPFSVALALEEIAPDGTKTAVPAAEVRERIELRVLEGLLARTLYLLGSVYGSLWREGLVFSAARQ